VYAQAIRTYARGLLLDLGCGSVPLYRFYRDYVTDNVCIDWAGTFHKTEHLDYECDLNREIPLPDHRFDTILATDVLEHIANPGGFWQEMARLLKPGGKIIVAVPFLYQVHEAPHDYARYTEYQLTRSCERHGLTVVSLEPYGGSVEVILDIIAKHLSFSKILSALHLAVSKFLSRLLAGRKVYKKIARRFPLGYVLISEKPVPLNAFGDQGAFLKNRPLDP
jgi:SAM-dependent methyltransferase